MLDRRGRLLFATVSAVVLPLPDQPAVRALHAWLDTWRGIGDLEAGMARQGYDLQLTRYANEAWRATSYIAGLASTGPTTRRAARTRQRLGVWSRLRRASRSGAHDLIN
jgi:hypothetical protein